MTKAQLTLGVDKIDGKLVGMQLTSSKVQLREVLDFNLKEFEKRLIETAWNHLVEVLKDYNPTASEKELKVFAKTFFELHWKKEYDIRTMEYTVTCTPQFKKVNMLKEEDGL